MTANSHVSDTSNGRLNLIAHFPLLLSRETGEDRGEGETLITPRPSHNLAFIAVLQELKAQNRTGDLVPNPSISKIRDDLFEIKDSSQVEEKAIVLDSANDRRVCIAKFLCDCRSA
jgi:hypothetical protein